MQKRSGWSASAAKALLLFSLITHCVSAVAIVGTLTAVSSNVTLPFSTATAYGAGGSNSSSLSTGLLLSTSGTIRSFNSSSSSSSSLLTSSTSSSLSTSLPTSPGSITTPTGPLPGTASSSSNNSSLYTLPTSPGSTTSPTGSLPGTASSSSLSLYSVTFGVPSIAAATIIQSGKTETVPVINGGLYSSPITLPPVTTTFALSQATSSVSSVSSELAGLIPIINSWKANPTLLKSDTLNKINPIKSDIEDLISNLGADSSSLGCGSKKKRGLLGTIGDIISRLSCIDEDLNSITNNINAEDVNVNAIDDFLDDLTSENDDLTDDDDDNNNSNTNSNSDSSTRTLTRSSSSSLSSCISSNTALQVTVQCVPTLFSTSGSTVSTTTCSPLTTVTASGCSVTGLTTTVSTSTSASKTQTACASGTCGDACPMNGGPLSGASMGTAASTEDCASISTSTTSALPTASYGVAGSIAIAIPTPESIAAAPSKRSFLSDSVAYDSNLVDRSIVERALPDVTPPYANYVRTLNPTWISQVGDASAQFFNYLDFGHSAAGVNGIYGCTSVIISSEKGVYISHIWENPVFIIGDFVPTDDNTFTTKAFNALRDGTANAQSILALVGTDQAPGPLNAIYSPKVFVLTPFTSDLDRQLYSITTTLRYQARAQQLAQQIAQIVPGSGGTGSTLGYTRTDQYLSTQNPGIAGRAILEVDPFQYWLTTPNAPNSAGLQVGRWRLWVEDQLITYQDFWRPNTTPPGGNQRRDVGYANPCASLASSSSTTATSSSTSKTSSDTSTISPVTSKTSSTLVTSTTSPSDDLNPSSCKYTVTSEIGITNAEYTLQPTIATMCLCDSSVQAGINTVTGTSSTSYLVCAVPSKITVSTLQPPSITSASPPSITAPPPTPVTTLVQSTTTPSQATTSPDLSSKVCVDCTNALGASECSAPNDQCLVDQCKNDKNCQTCGIDCSSFFSPGKPDPQPGPRPYR